MGQLIVRGLEDDVKRRLRERASSHGQSMEAEVRDILRDALKKEDEPSEGLGSRIAKRFTTVGLQPHETIEELRGSDIRDPFEK